MVATPEDVTVESPRAGVAVVAFTGEHDLATSESVSEVLETLVGENELVVADFSSAQFVDSSMLNVLVATEQLARERGTIFRIQLGTEAIVERAFQISGILQAISWTSSREEALIETRSAA
jgi:anti-anti-sigma factor